MLEELFGPLPQKYTEYSRDINGSGTHLLAIINDILDLSKAEASRMTLSECKIDLCEVVVGSKVMVQRMAADAGVRLEIEVAKDLPLVLADPTRLRQILVNLLSNAIKFTPANGTVSLTVLRDRNGVSFRVADTGIGIPADKIAVALSPFGQVDSGLARKYEGTGLGLPLTKKLAELHGGTVQLESVVDQGTVVTVWLPPERVVMPAIGDMAVA
jgi:signal transduction histidine kinase